LSEKCFQIQEKLQFLRRTAYANDIRRPIGNIRRYGSDFIPLDSNHLGYLIDQEGEALASEAADEALRRGVVGSLPRTQALAQIDDRNGAAAKTDHAFD
jgi:hypothetical protein